MKKRISSVDVAKEAGVSRATVSYVLNNVKGIKIKSETRQKVINAAKKLGYHPNSIARALKTKKSMSIGVVSKRNVAEARFSYILKGIKDVLKNYKYSITLCSDEENEQGNPEYINYYLTRKIDGIIIVSAEEKVNKNSITNLYENKIPTVLVDYHIKEKNMNCVDINYYTGGYAAAKYLINNGHKNIMYLAPKLDIPQEIERLKGVKKAIDEAKMAKLKLISVRLSEKEGFEKGIIKALTSRNDYSALIVSWSIIALKTLYMASKLNIKVPDEIAVISLAGVEFADYSYPKLSTCDLPLYDIGSKSAQVLMESINRDCLPVNISLPCVLNIRDSV